MLLDYEKLDEGCVAASGPVGSTVGQLMKQWLWVQISAYVLLGTSNQHLSLENS